MRTYQRNVRRAWDGDEYHAPKRQRVEEPNYSSFPANENQPILDIEDNLERAIRETSVAALSSSPSRKNSTVFSYGTREAYEPITLTPPSSPPPILDITPPVIKQRKPTFSSLDKKKQKENQKNLKRKRDEPDIHECDESAPLSEIMNSSTHTSAVAVPTMQQNEFQPVQLPKPTPSINRQMTQSVLDFGQTNTPVTCGQCQMSYTPSAAEDVKLHSMYHNRHKDGIELDKAFMKSAMKWCYEVPNIPGSVVVVDRKISLPARRTVQKVLEVVNRELGSIEIPETELWGQKSLDGELDDTNAKKVDCYKVFLHVINGKCVAVCLAERISKAYKVKTTSIPIKPSEKAQASDPERDLDGKDDPALLTPTSSATPQTQLSSSADLQIEDIARDVLVGVSRIWTSKTFRKRGIANNLLDCVLTQFIYGLDIEKEQVAFSQPTDVGAALAKSWFEAEAGWNVYKEV